MLDGLADVPDAVRIGDQALSGERLLGCAAAVGERVRGARVVAVDATPTAETVVAVVGALLAGTAVVPVPPDSGPVERDHLLRDSGAEMTIAGDLNRTSSATFPDPPDDATALILYTSGTTGAPKGAILSHRAVAAGLDALAGAWEWTPDDVLVHGLPLFHVHGLVLGVLGPLRIGGRLLHTGKPTPEAYAAAVGDGTQTGSIKAGDGTQTGSIKAGGGTQTGGSRAGHDAGGTLYFGVPTVWGRIAANRDAARALRGARLLVSGSAALPVPVFEALHELSGHRPVERYGMTETLITISNRADDPDRRPGVVGWPVDGVRTRVVDDTGHDVTGGNKGEIGELLVNGPMLFDGYRNQPPFRDEWFATGDIATVDGDGRHRIVGRRSTDLIKSGGYKIGAGEVEDALLAHPSVREAAVVGTPHDDLGQQVTAYVVADGVTDRELIDFVARTLSAHKRPRDVRFVADLPRNAMGKVQKTLLEP